MGANIGIHVLNAKRINPALKVVACEASVFNATYLLTNVGDLPDVTVLPVAMGARSGLIYANGCASNLTCQVDPSASYPQPAPCFALDDLCLPHIDLLKLDVEGFECEVLRGAASLLHRWRPVILFEAFVPGDAHALLASLHYKLRQLSPADWIAEP